MKTIVIPFYEAETQTISYIAADPDTGAAAIVDPVLDYNARAGRTGTGFADQIIARMRNDGLTLRWILETHAHADHLSAAPYLQEQLGGAIAIGKQIGHTQTIFATVFDMGPGFRADGSQFDHLFDDNEIFRVGDIEAQAIHTPGHTPACMTYLIGDAAFIGDTLFMPDYGTARCDFPGGDAAALYRSIQKIYALPPDTRLFLCHDYQPGGRAPAWETSIAEQRVANIHIHDGVGEAEFVAMRNERDKTLPPPLLILPSIQVNIRAGRLPEPHANGVRYLSIPINQLPIRRKPLGD